MNVNLNQLLLTVPFMKKRTVVTFLFLTVAFFLTGCATTKPPSEPPNLSEPAAPEDLTATTREQLKEAKANWKHKAYEAIATKEGAVACVDADEGCGELHLLTGHACFRLANYQCAANHLEAGITQTKEWALEGIGLNRRGTYMNLLESLRSNQTKERGEALKKTSERLLNMTKAFIALEPKNPAGTFFLVSAQFAHIRGSGGTKDLHRRCQELTGLLSDLQKAGPPSSIRYEIYYRQLLSDITGAKAAMSGCP